MAEQMEGLSFEISQTGAEDSAKSLNTLASALTRLASASSKLNTNSLQSQATQISSLVDSLSKVDAEGVGKSLESLKNSLNDFSKIKSTKSLSTTAENVRRLMESLNSIQGTDKIRQVSSVLSDLSNISKNGISTKLATGLDKLSVAMKNVSSDDIARLERLRDVLKDMSGISSLPNLRGITANNLSANSGKTENNSIADTNPKEQDTSSVTVTASRYAQVTKALSSIQSAAKGVKSSLVGIFTNPQAAANSFSGTVQKLGSAFNKVALGIPTKAVSGLGSAFKSASTKVSGFLSSIGRIAMYRAVRAAIAAITQALKTGINNLYQYSSLMGTTFAGSMDSLATSAQYLTNSLGAMAAPLIQAVAPAIEYVINKIVELLNWFNMLIARLTGSSTATVAKRAATSFGDVGSSAGNAAGSVAELQKTILGFDEINALNDNSSGGSGGGSGSGSGSDYGSMFEEVPIDAAVSDFADALKAAFDAGDWETLGTLLADKVNGIVDSIDFKGIGKKIGYGLNGAIQTAYYFLEKVNFENIGAGIAEMLNGALSEIDGEFIGRLIVRWFTAGWDFVIGFLKTFDFYQFTKTISDGIKGAMDELSEWISKTDWVEVGKGLVDAIADSLGGVDYGGLAYSFGKLIGSAARAGLDTLIGIGQEIMQKIRENISDEDGNITGESIVKAIWSGIKWTIDTLGEEFIAGIVDGFFGEGTYEVFKEKGVYAGTKYVLGLSDGVNDSSTWSSIHSALNEYGENSSEWYAWPLSKALQGFATTGEIVQDVLSFFGGIKDKLTGKGNDDGGGYTGGISAYIAGFNPITIINTVLGWFGITDDMEDAGNDSGESFLDGLGKPFVTIGTWLKNNVWDPIVNWFSNNPFTGFWNWLTGNKTDSDNTTTSLAQTNSKKSQTTTTTASTSSIIGSDQKVNVKIGLTKSGWTTIGKFVGEDTSVQTNLKKGNWSTIASYVGKATSVVTNLKKGNWSDISSFVGKAISVTTNLLKGNWSDISSFIGKAVSVTTNLLKGNWTTVSSFVGNLISITTNLKKGNWTSASSYVGDSVSVKTNLKKGNWTSISDYVGNYVQVKIGLIKSGWDSVKAFLNLATGGTITGNNIYTYSGATKSTSTKKTTSATKVTAKKTTSNKTATTKTGRNVSMYASGGVITSGMAKRFANVPHYANGSSDAHGTAFIAGEAGPEILGHINGRTEILNQSQLAATMHSAIIAGMSAPINALSTALGGTILTCTNAQIAALNNVNTSIRTTPTAVAIGTSDYGDDEMADKVRRGVSEAMSSQNSLLREQNRLLQQLLAKDNTVEITTSQITSALSRKNTRDGVTVVPVST